MNIKKIGCQESNYNYEFAKRFSQKIDAREETNQMRNFEGGSQSQQQSLIHANSGSGFYETERFMGSSQYDYQVAKNPNTCLEISMNYNSEILPYQHSEDGYYIDQSLEQASPKFVAFQTDPKSRTVFNQYTVKERILQLKRKLLGEYDTLDRKIEIPFDGDNDLKVSPFYIFVVNNYNVVTHNKRYLFWFHTAFD